MLRKRNFVTEKNLTVKLEDLQSGILLKKTSNHGFDIGGVPFFVLEKPENKILDFFKKNIVPFNRSRVILKVLKDGKVTQEEIHIKYKNDIPYIMNIAICNNP